MILCQLSDLHVREHGVLANRMVDTNTLVERAFRAIAALDPLPDAIVITGDITECGRPGEYAVVRELLALLPGRVYLIPGNHDRRENFRAALADWPGITDDPVYIQYVVDDLPLRLVLLDSVAPGYGHGELDADRLGFLDRALAAAPDRPTVVALHHPPFSCGVAPMDRINLDDKPGFAAVIARHRQVRRILCGHQHRPIMAPVAHAIASVAPSVAHQTALSLRPDAASGFTLEPPGYQLHVEAGGVIVTHTAPFGTWPGPYPFIADPDYPGSLP
jgi:3',5'-cyclic AMP phosphodiesterase CpdA